MKPWRWTSHAPRTRPSRTRPGFCIPPNSARGEKTPTRPASGARGGRGLPPGTSRRTRITTTLLLPSMSCRPRRSVPRAPTAKGGGALPPPPPPPRRGRKKIKKDTRAAAFASLLVREFGVDALRGGAGVVDVAGGSGALSHELVTRWGVPCTIVDPRGDGVKTTARHRRLFASRDANAAAIAAEIGWSARSPLARHLLQEWTGFGKAAHVKRSFDASGMREAHFAALLRDCSAIVGMHPDQATGALVDAALALRKPFAVVPCCVFPESHPERVSRATGERVRTTAELVDARVRARGREPRRKRRRASRRASVRRRQRRGVLRRRRGGGRDAAGDRDARLAVAVAAAGAPPPGPFRLRKRGRRERRGGDGGYASERLFGTNRR